MTPAQQVDIVVERLRAKGFTVKRDEMPPIARTFAPKGVILHHTASTSRVSLDDEKADVANLKRDQVGWPAPHVQFYVAQSSRIWVVTDGMAYHAGLGTGLVNQGIPADQANTYCYGIEGQSDGYGRDFSDEQWLAYHALTGELLRVMNVPVEHVWRHKDYYSGKVDTRYGLDQHRNAVRKYLAGEQEDVMQKEDFDKIEQIVNKAVKAGNDDLLHSDVTNPEDKDKITFREAVRVLYRKAVGK